MTNTTPTPAPKPATEHVAITGYTPSVLPIDSIQYTVVR